MKIVVAPDSFKHSMSAAEVCDNVSEAVYEVLPDVQVVKIPVADGGEGTIDAMIAAVGGQKVYFRVKGPEFNEVEAYYGLLDGNTAVIELAAICGLMMVTSPNPEKTTTYGVGQMIKKALDDGCKKLILCIGGSATNDAGIGALSALGVRFTDGDREVVPCGENLSKILSIDAEHIDKRLNMCELLIACDVNNPLYGKNGAAYIFAPQKGADRDMVLRLDEGLRHFAGILYKHTQKDVAQIPGSGAAGGIAAGFLAFCGVSLKPGIEIVLDAIDFDRRIDSADVIITGEGKTDKQTLSGKTVLGVTRRAVRKNIPVFVVSGAVEDDVDEALYGEGVKAVFSCCRLARPFDEIRNECPKWLRQTIKNILRMQNFTVGI